MGEQAQAIRRKVKKMRRKRREASWGKATRRRPQSRQGTKKTPRAREKAQAIRRKVKKMRRQRREVSWRKMTRRRPQSRQGTKKTQRARETAQAIRRKVKRCGENEGKPLGGR